MSADQIAPLTILLIFALGSNLPLGYFRARYQKFSLPWFILIHASIPFIILLRNFLDFSWRWIPLTLAAAVLGQLLGVRYYRRKAQ